MSLEKTVVDVAVAALLAPTPSAASGEVRATTLLLASDTGRIMDEALTPATSK